VAVDYLVHHAGARGPRGPKVFKLTTRTLEPSRPQTIIRRHRFREVSVRRLYPGIQRIDIQVNGRVLGGADVRLLEGELGREQVQTGVAPRLSAAAYASTRPVPLSTEVV
jgi:hypothetical protein